MVYNGKRGTLLWPDFNHFLPPVSHDPSRKSFLGKLFALAAFAGVAPRLLAKTVSRGAASEADAPAAPKSFSLRPDSRAVARRNDSV